MKRNSLRKQVHNSLEITWRHRTGLSFWVNIFLTIVITLNAIAIIINTVPSIQAKFHRLLFDFEVFSVVVFSLEYLLRLWSCVENNAFSRPFTGRLKFAFSFWGLVDFLSILPFYVFFFLPDLSFIRILRLLRMLRLFRVSKYFHALKVIQNVVNEKREELILSFVFIFFVLIISSSTVYYLEHEFQPNKFTSIPKAMWWGVNAMTTVGYGDMYPITPMGRFIGGLLAIAGVALFALPTGILASGFAEHIRKNQNTQTKITCPHCGEKFNPNHSH